MLKNKHILLGVSGSIAAYKIASVASHLVKRGAKVTVLMTKNATHFITQITFETLTGNKCLVDTFDRNFDFSVEHVAIAKSADLMLIAPATANLIGKLAAGIADDMLTTTVLALRCPILLSPAMNTAMYENRIVQDNLERLHKFGFQIIDPAVGYLACGDTGAGKMPEPETLISMIEYTIGWEKDLQGKKVLITAGPTREAIDPVRFISNHSTGKMGFALAKIAAMRGAEVTLISGPVSIDPPDFVNFVSVVSAKEMFAEVEKRACDQNICICCAAVADMRPTEVASEKIKKDGKSRNIELSPTIDILAWLGEHRSEKQVLVGFAMETEHLIENARLKLERKKADLIVANSLRTEGAGFAGNTNVVTFVSKENEEALPLMTKEEVAGKILDWTARKIP
ncbi:MAG: bifunctional phosphopantothenoylcysteine decarboxylase/phosphopantothenate--cysteine ligase CoaBC [Lachnospiraceae bacterium]|nr:bifunctional phosphopantothenoylcysteine decarboxylase/phosphopantothenate--cysteine ligase CoaBC [Lachnospiraceae bacterium]